MPFATVLFRDAQARQVWLVAMAEECLGVVPLGLQPPRVGPAKAQNVEWQNVEWQNVEWQDLQVDVCQRRSGTDRHKPFITAIGGCLPQE